MSGIAGIVRFDGGPVQTGLVERMTELMAHRGPDGIEHFHERGVALGQCLLRTTPESLEETLPLASEDGQRVLVMDGRVDNWEELRVRLLDKGARLRSRADAELVLRAYERWGEECLARIDGDFAFAIWDARKRELFAARDRMGARPFCYHWNGRRLAFASDVNAILALPDVPQDLDEATVAEFLACDWHARDRTFWRGIQRLPGAQFMKVGMQGPEPHEYWLPDPALEIRYKRDEEYVEHYRAALTDAVRRLSRTHRPLACEVSGGLDSSSVFTISEHLRREERLLAPALEGYTLFFGDGSPADEIDYAHAVGEHLGRQIHEVPPSRMPLEWFGERAAFCRDIPGVPNGAMGLGIRQAALSRGSRVLLNGAGGDQWICGSRSYYAEALGAGQVSAVRRHLVEDSALFGGRTSVRWLARHGLLPLLPRPFRRALRALDRREAKRQSEKTRWLVPRLERKLADRTARAGRPDLIAAFPPAKRERISTFLSAHRSHAFDVEERSATHEGLELRRPFYSTEIVKLAFSFPERIFLNGRIDRYIHRRAFEDILPTKIMNRETKGEFSITYLWYLHDIRENIENSTELDNWIRRDLLESIFANAEILQQPPLYKRQAWHLFACKSLVHRDNVASGNDVTE